MKKSIILCLLFPIVFFAHDQLVHQHIIREAFKLLVKSYPQLQYSEFANYIGTNETNANSFAKSWGDGTVAAGAWIEDEYDIVNHYGIGHTPDFLQFVTPEIANFFGNIIDGDWSETSREAYVSVNHFWDADGGVDKQTLLKDFINDVKWSFYVENAMQKVNDYIYGWYYNRCVYKSVPHNYSACLELHIMTDFHMPGILDLYNNNVNYLSTYKYLSLSSLWLGSNCSAITINKGEAYEILGRICHLLGDMSVPAHVHTRSHACSKGMYCDYYENSAPGYPMYTANDIWNSGDRFINPYVNYGHPLYYLMYYMNQLTDHFATGKDYGDDVYDRACPGLSQIVSNSNWTSMDSPSEITDSRCRAMHSVLFKEVIKATAGVLYWFAKETGILQVTKYYIKFDPPQFNTSLRTLDSYLMAAPGDNYKYYLINGYEKDYYVKYYYELGLTVSVEAKYEISSGGFSYYFSKWSDGVATRVRPVEMTTNRLFKAIYTGGWVGTALAKNITHENVEQNHNVEIIPEQYSLDQNYPNPFNPVTSISFEIKESGPTSLKVYNSLGETVATLLDDFRNAGSYRISFDGSNFPSGLYFYSLRSNNFADTKKMVLTK